MATYDMAGKVQTVLGPIDPAKLGVTLTHEHLLVDDPTVPTNPPQEASAKGIFHKPLSLEILGYVRHHAFRNADNALLLDIPTAIEEVMLYKQYGGESLVDAAPIGLGRDPVALARISRATGLNVIMGASFYVDPGHPPDMDSRSEDDLVEQIARDVTEGVDGTGIRSGIIGEVGCSWPLTGNERKVLRASGRAHLLTGAPLLVHPGRSEKAPLEILDVLSDVVPDLSRTIMCHVDRTIFQRSVLKQVAESGCYLEWDLFGKEISYYGLNLGIDMPNDATRMDQIAWLSSQGYREKILIAHDLATKDRLLRYGGHGYFYILAHIVPRMRARGFSQEAIQRFLVDNPRSVLTFSEPKEA